MLSKLYEYYGGMYGYTTYPASDAVYVNMSPNDRKRLDDYCWNKFGSLFRNSTFDEQDEARSWFAAQDSGSDEVEQQNDRDKTKKPTYEAEETEEEEEEVEEVPAEDEEVVDDTEEEETELTDTEQEEKDKENELDALLDNLSFVEEFSKQLKQHLLETVLKEDENAFTKITYVRVPFEDDKYALSFGWDSSVVVNKDSEGRFTDISVPTLADARFYTSSQTDEGINIEDEDVLEQLDTIITETIEDLKNIK